MIWNGLWLSEPDFHIEQVNHPTIFADWLRDEGRPHREIEAAILGIVDNLAWVEARIQQAFPPDHRGADFI